MAKLGLSSERCDFSRALSIVGVDEADEIDDVRWVLKKLLQNYKEIRSK